MHAWIPPSRVAVAFLVALATANVEAIECTPPPPTAPRNYQGYFDIAAARVFGVRGPGAAVAIQSEVKSLLEKIPNADKTLIELTYLFTLCTALRDSRSMPEAEKGRLIAEYGRALRAPPPATPIRTSPVKSSGGAVSTPARVPDATKPNVVIQGNTGTTVIGNDVKGDMNLTTTNGK